jgi:predicted transcriptional regulator
MKDENEDNGSSEEQNIDAPAITVKVSEGPIYNEESWENNQPIEVVETIEETVEETPTETTEVVETTEEAPITEEVIENVQANIDETAVLNFLKEKGITAEKLEDLKPKEVKQLTPEVEKFLEFKEKTGNSSFTDFLATQKDWSQEPKEIVLMENLKAENPTLNQKQLEFLFKKTYE